MQPTIEESAASLRDKHMPARVRPFTGSPTTTARGSEALARPRRAVAPVVEPAATPPRVRAGARPVRPTVVSAAPAGNPGVPASAANAQPWKDHPSTQPLPVDRRVFRSIEPVAGHIIVRVQAGKTPMRAAKAALGDARANGLDGFPVRVVQSTSDGVTLMSRSDDHAAGKDPIGVTTIAPGGDTPQAPAAPKVA